jgi:hypothetical protein
MHTMASLSIQPGLAIERDFAFEADALNLRELEVVGTFEPPVGSDRGPSGFWFWGYAVEPTRNSPVPSRAGLVALKDMVARPDHVAGKTVTVQGQFRGRNLFRDLDAASAPADGWVIKDGPFAVWVVGRKPKGSGWSLDADSRGDTTRWVQVTGKLENKEGVTWLKADKVDLVAPPTEFSRP